MTVHKVIRVIASHRDSWEQATRVAVAEATTTIRDLRYARVIDLDSVIDDEGIHCYRVKLEMSFRLDRTRPGASPDAPSVQVTRSLIVANHTLASAELTATVLDRIGSGPSEFHVVVPSTHSADYLNARRAALMGDPVTGYVPADFVPGEDTEGLEQAEARLETVLQQIGAAGADVTGEIGDADPVTAVSAVLSRGSFDNIIVCTMPPGISRWLGMDLPSRIRRVSNLPVTHVVATEL
jgi:flavin-binding protein dodecin